MKLLFSSHKVLALACFNLHTWLIKGSFFFFFYSIDTVEQSIFEA